ncbi:TPA: hypothetical protein ACXLVH_002311 [Legionella anisa]
MTNYDNVEVREAEFKLRLQSVLADSDQTARYIGDNLSLYHPRLN